MIYWLFSSYQFVPGNEYILPSLKLYDLEGLFVEIADILLENFGEIVFFVDFKYLNTATVMFMLAVLH